MPWSWTSASPPAPVATTARSICSPRPPPAARRPWAGPTPARSRAGALADFVTVSLDTPRTAGTRAADAIAAVVFSATAADVTHVVVGGRLVVDGRCSPAAARRARPPSETRSRRSRDEPRSIDNIGLLVTYDPALGEDALGERHDAALVVEDGVVVAVVAAGTAVTDDRLDVEGRCVLPGFVDSHTHLVFAGDRADEFAARMAGQPYAAGGIRVTTVDATRAASDDELRRLAAARRAEARRAASPRSRSSPATGSTADEEARCLRIAGELTARHDVPRRPRRARPSTTTGPTITSRTIVTRMLPACAPLARFADAFCETGAFDADQCRAVLTAAAARGLGPKLHANQLGTGPGVQLAVELGAASADHCTYLTDGDIEALAGAAATTVATLLPATDFSHPPALPARPPPARSRRHGRPRHQLQPGFELHDLDAVRHRPRRARAAPHRGRGRAGGHGRRRRRAPPHRRRPPRSRATGPTPSSSTPPALHAPRLPPGRRPRRRHPRTGPPQLPRHSPLAGPMSDPGIETSEFRSNRSRWVAPELAGSSARRLPA